MNLRTGKMMRKMMCPSPVGAELLCLGASQTLPCVSRQVAVPLYPPLS